MISSSRRPFWPFLVGIAFMAVILVLGEIRRGSCAAPPRPPVGSAEVLLRNFSGVNNPGFNAERVRQLGLGWIRWGLNWDKVEPQKGQWAWGGMDSAVSGALASGAEFLPGLLYSAPWAAQKKGDIFSPAANVADWENYVEAAVS